ncbi:MAG: molybdenum cofactor biosynthesis protein MoaD [Methylibium sp. NZG]|nr:MAG: molybdenum cofactor biosynthesis protein MoaD [Methylibium sp. NZG]
MKVRVRYFASIREALGPGEELTVPDGCTASVVRELLIARSPAHAAVLGTGRALRCAVDQTLSDGSTALRDGAELAFFPPVTGG